VEWDAYDIETPEGLRIEVKTSGYLQSWAQSRHSVIGFDIGRKHSWTAETNTYSSEPGRPAHVYVFAVHKHLDKATVDPLDVDQWEFYVVPTPALDQSRLNQKSIRLSALRQVAGPPTDFENLAPAIRRAGANVVVQGGTNEP
jgi:hypothetical protein